MRSDAVFDAVAVAEEIEVRTPGWHWFGYRLWRYRGEVSGNGPSMYLGEPYRVTSRRRWIGRPGSDALVAK